MGQITRRFTPGVLEVELGGLCTSAALATVDCTNGLAAACHADVWLPAVNFHPGGTNAR